MRHLLIVSPRFPPTNAADMHRVRLSLPFYKANGWTPIVLTVAPDPAGSDDPDMLKGIPDDIEIIRVPIWRESVVRKFGFGHLDYRSLMPLFLAGRELLKRRKIDVVFFSTTVFLSFVLGPLWKRRFGCKIVYDYQDPWYHGETLPYTRDNAPGSWWKYRVTQMIAKQLEPFVLRRADHVISVSDGYVNNLLARYPWLSADMFTVMPFPASRLDFDLVKELHVRQDVFQRGDGRRHFVYAGRGGPDMELAISLLCRCLATLKAEAPDLAQRLQVHFVGTSYAPADRVIKTVEPVAHAYGVADIVVERPHRLAYFQVLALYQDADVVLLIGSESADYTASKFLNCILSGRPVLALFHEGSLVTSLAAAMRGVFLVPFDGSNHEVAEKRLSAGLQLALNGELPTCSSERVPELMAEPATARQCAIFDRSLNQ